MDIPIAFLNQEVIFMPFLEIEAGITLYYEERGSGNRHIISARSRLEHLLLILVY